MHVPQLIPFMAIEWTLLLLRRLVKQPRRSTARMVTEHSLEGTQSGIRDCIINCPMTVVIVALEPTSLTRWNQRPGNLPTPPQHFGTSMRLHTFQNTRQKHPQRIPQRGAATGHPSLWMGLTSVFKRVEPRMIQRVQTCWFQRVGEVWAVCQDVN